MRDARIVTYTGKEVNPLKLRVEDVNIVDIAHSLSQTNRFAGHTEFPISVAQHSVFVHYLCHQSLRALLHDAAEAYLGDVTKWLKHSPEMLAFCAAENDAQAVIYEALGCTDLCPVSQPGELDAADKLMVRFEAKRGFGSKFTFDVPEYDVPITNMEATRIGRWQPWSALQAERSFLSCFIAGSYWVGHAVPNAHTEAAALRMAALAGV